MRKMGMRTAWAIVCGVSLWLPSAQAWAADSRPVGEQLLPQEVLLFFSIPSIPELKERMGSSLFGEMLQDPELQPFIDGVKEKIEEASEEMKDKSGVSLDTLLEIPQGEITFAVLELPPRKLAMVLLIDYGDNKDTMDKLLDHLESALKDQGGDVSAEEVGDATIRNFTFEQEEENPFNQFAYFDQDNYLVMASDPEALKAVLERWDGESDDTLAEQDVFHYIMEKCASDDREPVLKWFFNPIGLTQSVVGMLQAQVPQAGLVLGFMPILGLDKFKAMGGAGDVGVEDYDSLSKTVIYVDQPTSGLLNLFQFPAADLSPPKWVPADAAAYTAVNWDVAGAYAAVENLVDQFQGPGAFSRLVDEASEDGPGIHIKKDFIDQLSGQIHVVMEPQEEFGGSPPILFAMDVKSTSKMAGVLAKAAKSDDFPGSSREFEGTTVYDIDAPNSGQSISIAVADKHLIVSTDTSLLENALRPSSGGESLSDDPLYKKLADKFPKKMSMMSFQNGNSQLKAIYDLVKSGNLPDMPPEVSDLISKLPDYEVLEKYLRAQASYTIPDKKGAYGVSFTLKEE